MNQITHKQALQLFRQLRIGTPLGVDSAGDVIYSDTPLTISLNALDLVHGTYLERADKPTQEHPYDTKSAVTFLRMWADALEVPTKGGV